MSRGVICDFRGNAVRVGDIVVYDARCKNGTRMTEAEVLRTYYDHYKGRAIPMMKVKPTGRETGKVKRRVIRVETVVAENFVIVEYAEDRAS